MADERAAEQPDTDEPEQAVSQPHDKYFYSVFSNEQDAASLLRTCVPRPLANTLKWSTLTRRSGRFVADDWRGREADLLFSVQREGTETPVLVYVLLEHQSTPDQWLRLRCSATAYRGGSSGSGSMRVRSGCRCWCRWHSRSLSDTTAPRERLGWAKSGAEATVFGRYQGAQRWRYQREFADLVSDAAPEWRWVPRFEHLLIDQTEMAAESVTGAVAARLLQIARGRVHRLRPPQQPRWTNPPRRGRPANRGHRRPARPTP